MIHYTNAVNSKNLAAIFEKHGLIVEPDGYRESNSIDVTNTSVVVNFDGIPSYRADTLLELLSDVEINKLAELYHVTCGIYKRSNDAFVRKCYTFSCENLSNCLATVIIFLNENGHDFKEEK